MRLALFKHPLSAYVVSLFCLTPLTTFAADMNTTLYQNDLGQPSPQAIRDPFTPSNLMFEIVSKQAGSAGIDAYGFMRSPSDSGVPKMRLRGYVTQDKSEPVALLEVAGLRTFLVREGDEINVDPSQPNTAIRIRKITRLSVTVETGTLGSIRVQR